ncbi:hypothetical protein FPOAC1_009481 [Fusarium poae]|uniref:hypothetical protein n=1 Tax=Fusarium poae TaxID=36050 RepID=UPI001CE90EBD|nr:hypothetical protein FPOAC1_009481 [Fusarium poae]KAG8670078.1 hypothetical protein FPOAC1_009481 [Fusarium poae]
MDRHSQCKTVRSKPRNISAAQDLTWATQVASIKTLTRAESGPGPVSHTTVHSCFVLLRTNEKEPFLQRRSSTSTRYYASTARHSTRHIV